ncbi:hypothetical protein IVB27_26880 [Bradyrhizobium sp. 197]|uniref:hypothetical protein n=1 Tax=Bradyrhizobium sp. 197 TaxID=2782663 RepID=UPI001FF8B7E1|nr:hypothetical protein [Bradyrhizobium sp. 197]MCK1478311.1 hypothetical protein [Bradyrhizobium sp. 197]
MLKAARNSLHLTAKRGFPGKEQERLLKDGSEAQGLDAAVTRLLLRVGNTK